MSTNYTMFRPRLRSRHPSHSILRPTRKMLPLLPFKSIIRLGSTTELDKTDNRVEINTVQAVKNSSNKLSMKTCFTQAEVKTADWWKAIIDEDGSFFFRNPVNNNQVNYNDIQFPLVVKKYYGSRNNGNTKINNLDELEDFIEDNNMDNYLFEKFYNYSREYRLHVSANGCFYTCRKMLKRDTPEEAKWYRNDEHCVWIMEENEAFDKPVNWDSIVEECVKALKAVELDVGAVDLRVQSATNSKGEARATPKFVVIEINSAPSFGTVTEQKYIEILPEILNIKHERTN